MAQHVKRSVVPIYLIGVVWLIHALVFPLYLPFHYILCAVESVVVFVIAKAIFPDKTYQTAGDRQAQAKAEAERTAPRQEAKKPETTGDPEIDALLKERDRALSEMRRLNDAIEDEKISAQIDHLEDVTAKIIGVVAKEPKKLPQIRRFMDYYLPTTLKILNAYDRMGSTGISGENIDATKAKVEKMMDTIVLAYDKQLDALFGEEALDISTDITVMEQLLRQEGLGGSAGEKKDSGDGITLEL